MGIGNLLRVLIQRKEWRRIFTGSHDSQELVVLEEEEEADEEDEEEEEEQKNKNLNKRNLYLRYKRIEINCTVKICIL
jgi:hypothetical protein